jgi:hypothetical protein
LDIGWQVSFSGWNSFLAPLAHFAQFLGKLVKAVVPRSIRFHLVSAHGAEERVGYLEICFAGQEVVPMKVSGHESRSVADRYNVMSRSDLSDAAKRPDNPKTGKLALESKTK